MVMVGLIVLSLVLEWILPLRLKEAAGRTICWMMMFITMTFLMLSTVGLLFVIGKNVILPMDLALAYPARTVTGQGRQVDAVLEAPAALSVSIAWDGPAPDGTPFPES